MKTVSLSAVATALALSTLAIGQTYQVTDLGTLNGSATYATSMNENGMISGYSLPNASSARAWIWKTTAGFTDAGSFGGPDNRGLAVGTDDKLYGASQNVTGVSRGFVFDSVALTLTDLGSLVAGDAVSAEGVNAGGTVVGFTTTGGVTLGFKISSGTMTALGTLSGADLPATSAAYDINDAGQIVGVASWIGGGTRAFRTDAGGALVSLGTLGANDSSATAINTSGQVAGYSVTPGNMTHAFLYNDGGGIRDLGVLTGGVESHAYGIDDAGDVVGSSEDSSGNARAFLWMPGGIRDLNDLIPPNSGWVLKEARDINNSGDIVGYGTINHVDHAFLLERFDGADTFAPVAVATVTPPGQGSTYTQVAVKFWDNEKVVSSTARTAGAIRISGPNLYDMPATAFMWTTNDSQIVNVSFNVPAPGGSWDPSDNGTYEVRVSANQVSDIAGNKHPGGVIATFSVGIQTAPSFSMTIPASATAGTPVSLTPTASSSYPSAVGDVFTYTIDWDGDGAGTQTIAGTSGALIAHTFTSIGTHTVRARCTDPHGVVSSERTATVVVSNSSVGLQSAVVLEAPAGATAGNTVATVKDGTMYFFGQQIENGTQAITWDYLTPGAGFIVRGDLDNGPLLPAGTGVDSRGRIVIYGGYEFGGVATPSCLTYTIAGGVGGGVANMPAAVYLGPSTSDNLSRLYFQYGANGTLYRYDGASGNGVWTTHPGIPGYVNAACMSFDGSDRIIAFVGTAVWAYSISGNVWTSLGTAPITANRAALGADGLIYLIAGAQVWAFDPASNSIAQFGTTTYNESGGHAVRGTDGWLYLIGGGANVERFDTRAATTLAPRISSTPAGTTIVQGNAWTYQVAAGGKPRPTLSLVRNPAGMSISASGLISWTPALPQAGPQTALVRASSSAGFAEQLITFNILTVVPDITAPSVPGNVTVLPPPNLTTNSADITWTAAIDNVAVVRYGIHTRRTGGTRWHHVTTYPQIGTTTGLSWHFANLPLCSTNTYYVAAYDAAGNRSPLVPITIRVLCIPTISGSAGGYAIEDEAYTSPGYSASGNPTPALSVTDNPAGAVWHPTAANTGYFTWTPAFGQGGDVNYTPPTQPAFPGTATFRLAANNIGGSTTQTYALPVWPKGTDLLPPAPVMGVMADSVTADSVHVAWQPTTDNYGVYAYRVTVAHRAPRSRFHHGPYNDHIVTVNLPASATDALVTGLRPSTSYVVTVGARDEFGVSSPGNATGLWSYSWSGAGFSTRPLPFAVANVQQTVNADGSLTMTWPNQGYYWKYTVQCTDSLATPNWQPGPPVVQWPSFYVTSYTFTPDPAVPSRFYRVLATPGL